MQNLPVENNSDGRTVVPAEENGKDCDLMNAEKSSLLEVTSDSGVSNREIGVTHVSAPQLPPAFKLKGDEIHKLASDAGVKPFRDEHNNYYLECPCNVSSGTWVEVRELKSIESRGNIHLIVKQKYRGIPNPSAIDKALAMFKSEAGLKPMIPLGNRVIESHGKHFIDLVTDDFRIVELDGTGWKVSTQKSPLFRRYAHQREQVIPVKNGSIDSLYSHLDIEDPGHQTLITTAILSAYLSDRITPTLLFIGGQGSGKTTRCERIRSLIDPSHIGSLGEHPDRELDQVFYQHATPCLENVGNFNRVRSDRICRAVTGAGVQKRKLFTDSESVVIAYRRLILMNGTELPSLRPDFLDRTIVIPCTRRNEFLPRTQLDHDFEQRKPEILGGLLDLLVKAIALLPTTPVPTQFRMADFAHFGRAVALAMGKPFTEFDECFSENIRMIHETLLEDAPLFKVVDHLASKHQEGDEWEGSAGQLLEELRNCTRAMKLPSDMKAIPKSGRWLTTELLELAPALESRGIIFERLPRKSSVRPVRLFKRRIAA